MKGQGFKLIYCVVAQRVASNPNVTTTPPLKTHFASHHSILAPYPLSGVPCSCC
ncbi:hypothetical protein BDB00DRAFT_803889 [Zychaea mexicana]|uniref:uncharacterized protein n=1 Tax=Zychaea mexicana TaxID=64656 RepID=UPI0022FE7A3B|nr:uncharacterized protein BDB00DRAFT_803889 [Zychaea mexicana]KAI9497749.1 hypothetical protein BDB00DRAFT_803889 [Zychaea mexicana]